MPKPLARGAATGLSHSGVDLKKRAHVSRITCRNQANGFSERFSGDWFSHASSQSSHSGFEPEKTVRSSSSTTCQSPPSVGRTAYTPPLLIRSVGNDIFHSGEAEDCHPAFRSASNLAEASGDGSTGKIIVRNAWADSNIHGQVNRPIGSGRCRWKVQRRMKKAAQRFAGRPFFTHRNNNRRQAEGSLLRRRKRKPAAPEIPIANSAKLLGSGITGSPLASFSIKKLSKPSFSP